MKKNVVIVGAGISGLAAGWFLKQRFGDSIDLKILEASNRPGGWIRSEQCGSFLFESGPRSCRTRGGAIETLRLIEALGLQDQVIAASSTALTRYLYTEGKLQQLPNSLLSFFTSPLMRGVIPALWRELWQPSGHSEDESIASFISRRFGKNITERFFDPLVSGVYAGNMHHLSIKSCFPDLYRLEQESGSIIKGLFSKKRGKIEKTPFIEKMLKHPIFSFKRGMETITHRLQEELAKEISLESPIVDMHLMSDRVVLLTASGQRIEADHVLLATPIEATASMLSTISPELGAEIRSIPTATVAVVNMGWNEKVLPYEGFGYLIPSSEKEEILGVVWDSSVFPQQNQTPSQTRLTVMLGGIHHPEVAKMSDDQLVKCSNRALAKHLHFKSPPDVVRVIMAKQAIPQYPVNHHLKMKFIEDTLSKVSASRVQLIGSSWHGVSIHDCISDAKRVCDASFSLFGTNYAPKKSG